MFYIIFDNCKVFETLKGNANFDELIHLFVLTARKQIFNWEEETCYRLVIYTKLALYINFSLHKSVVISLAYI